MVHLFLCCLPGMLGVAPSSPSRGAGAGGALAPLYTSTLAFWLGVSSPSTSFISSFRCFAPRCCSKAAYPPISGANRPISNHHSFLVVYRGGRYFTRAWSLSRNF